MLNATYRIREVPNLANDHENSLWTKGSMRLLAVRLNTNVRQEQIHEKDTYSGNGRCACSLRDDAEAEGGGAFSPDNGTFHYCGFA